MDERKRIAIYGGTFDPVHCGHLQIARTVSQLFAIDQFLFMPALIAPHKVDREVSSAFHRYAMLSLATEHDERLLVSTYELAGRERQYTVDTLGHFGQEFGDAVELFFVMGLDSWAEITTWREWQRLPTLANLIVVTRPGFDFSVAEVGSEIASAVRDVRGRDNEIAGLIETDGKLIFITDAVHLDISATGVRKAAIAGEIEKLNELVPHEVGEYIRKYRLYRKKHEAKLKH